MTCISALYGEYVLSYVPLAVAGFQGSAVHVTYEQEDRVLILAFKVRTHSLSVLLHADPVSGCTGDIRSCMPTNGVLPLSAGITCIALTL